MDNGILYYYNLNECIYFVNKYDNILISMEDTFVSFYSISDNLLMKGTLYDNEIINKRLKNNINLLNNI